MNLVSFGGLLLLHLEIVSALPLQNQLRTMGRKGGQRIAFCEVKGGKGGVNGKKCFIYDNSNIQLHQ